MNQFICLFAVLEDDKLPEGKERGRGVDRGQDPDRASARGLSVDESGLITRQIRSSLT